jgi:hypothetical protein
MKRGRKRMKVLQGRFLTLMDCISFETVALFLYIHVCIGIDDCVCMERQEDSYFLGLKQNM